MRWPTVFFFYDFSIETMVCRSKEIMKMSAILFRKYNDRRNLFFFYVFNIFRAIGDFSSECGIVQTLDNGPK